MKNRYKINWDSFLVPMVFIILSIVGIVYSGKPFSVIMAGIVERFGRNAFLVMALIIPVIAGIGLNFSIVVGAIAAQMALLFVIDSHITGASGAFLAMALATPLAILFGTIIGNLFNRAIGREMVAGLIAGFLCNGLYQLIFLFLAGPFIPVKTANLLITRGHDEAGNPILIGIRNTIDLSSIQYALDDFIAGPRLFGLTIPYFVIVLIALACLFVFWFLKTKLGQEMRAVGHNRHIAEVSGINVKKIRILATVISTVMASWGQIIFLQNIGTINTYSSHEQVGMFAIAALLVSGASVSKASVWNALLGTILFHTIFLTSPLAGNTLFGEAQIGEFFRVFIAYIVIAVALVLHSLRESRQLKRNN